MINEKFWNRELNQFEIPKFQCPICQKGLLISDKEKSIQETTKKSNDFYELLGEPECYEGYFSVISRCNNPDCKEITIIAGETKKILYGYEKDLDLDRSDIFFDPAPSPIYKTAYSVNYTHPSIRLMHFPKNTPKEIADIIDQSFKLFWIDENSCGNKIRSGIEKLLDLQKIKKRELVRRKRKYRFLTLHQRIVLFKDKKPQIAEYLLALKWIGNQGSHNGVTLGRKELMDAYKILEISLTGLYDKSRIEVNKLTKKINKQKKHRAT